MYSLASLGEKRVSNLQSGQGTRRLKQMLAGLKGWCPAWVCTVERFFPACTGDEKQNSVKGTPQRWGDEDDAADARFTKVKPAFLPFHRPRVTAAR